MFKMATEGQRWHIVGWYIAPDYASTIEVIVTAIGKFPRRTDLIVASNFNEYLEEPELNLHDD